MSGRRRQVFFALLSAPLLLFVIVLGVAMTRGVGGRPLGSVDPRLDIAADFTLPTFDEGSFTLSEYAGGPVFVYFWASWCPPCRQEAPLIERLWPEYRARGYTFVGVNIQDSEADARAFIDEYGITFPAVRATGTSVYVEYGVYGLPEGFFLRPGMIVNEKFIGALKESGFRAMLDRLSGSGS